MAGEPFGPVIVGVDVSTSMAAVDLAAEEALARVAPLIVLNVHGDRPADASAGERLVELAASRARSEHPGLDVTAVTLHGDPTDELLRAAHDASLLVLDRPHRRGPVIIASDSVATAVARRADIPVLLHAPLAEAVSGTAQRPVVLGLDGTRAGDAVVEFAFGEAALRGTVLHAIHVWSADVDAESSLGAFNARGLSEARQRAEVALDDTLARWMEKYPEVRVRRALRHSLDVPVVLTAASRSGQLLVVGAHHIADAFVPALVHRAGCPVALVPVDER